MSICDAVLAIMAIVAIVAFVGVLFIVNLVSAIDTLRRHLLAAEEDIYKIRCDLAKQQGKPLPPQSHYVACGFSPGGNPLKHLWF